MMNDYKEDKPCCYFHPTELLLGVCPLCLNERLVILACQNNQSPTHQKPKIFALAASLLGRFESRHRKSEDCNSTDASSSHEGSFISIRFGDDGVGSWETANGKASKRLGQFWSTKTVVEHVKSHAPSLRWRKRIGHLCQFSRWKRSNKGSVCHVDSNLEGVKVRNNGWIRSLTKKRTKVV